MAHDLHFNAAAQKYSAFTIGSTWHGLNQGQDLTDPVTREVAMRESFLDYEVVKKQLKHPEEQDKLIESWGLFRKDTNEFLANCGRIYKPLQNSIGFDLIDTLIAVEDKAYYVSAGALGKGERVFIQAKIPFDFLVKDQPHRSYLLANVMHTGKDAVTLKPVVEKVVCNNTLLIALGEKSVEYKIMHTMRGEERIEQIKELLSNCSQDFLTIEDKLNFLASQDITQSEIDAIFKELFPQAEGEDTPTRTKNVIEEIKAQFERENVQCPETKDSVYNLLNAFTYHVDHMRSVRNSGIGKNLGEDQARKFSSIFGSGSDFKQKVFNLMMRMFKK